MEHHSNELDEQNHSEEDHKHESNGFELQELVGHLYSGVLLGVDEGHIGFGTKGPADV